MKSGRQAVKQPRRLLAAQLELGPQAGVTCLPLLLELAAVEDSQKLHAEANANYWRVREVKHCSSRLGNVSSNINRFSEHYWTTTGDDKADFCMTTISADTFCVRIHGIDCASLLHKQPSLSYPLYQKRSVASRPSVWIVIDHQDNVCPSLLLFHH
eukprot:CAMPEP_0115058618 /NCGR_PEP_ID=MMETSP0227-20121206/6450_1 /TAXON_ID=89957 /ORGANISM="Polarella glacialis, Strain CCMP 1383" /LENGTH=155 /DNA_ID=CAMNT_0002443625 /DNA_START=363 /DNA_END=827 /DNA_ORIENTATION=-